jgi:hypothetical protein
MTGLTQDQELKYKFIQLSLAKIQPGGGQTCSKITAPLKGASILLLHGFAIENCNDTKLLKFPAGC